jgi:deazaflavin-dependent oxidoreductase (nitroreductase family)
MWKRIVLIATLVIAVLSATFVLGLRLKVRPVQDRVRRMNRALLNPMMLKTAGNPGAPASIIHHVGRTSGRAYETPVGPVKTETGFVFPLPYGTSPDWLKNVLAAGSADLVYEGESYRVDHPELVSADVGNPYFPPITQLTHRLFGVDRFLLMRRVEAA